MPAVLITGASTGIGEACALHLDLLGHVVYAGVRKDADGERLSARASERLIPVMLDVTDHASIAAAIETIDDSIGAKRFAGVVNNAGVGGGGPLEYLPIEEWREVLDVNVIGQVAVTQACMPLIRKGRGRIVFIGSIGGRVGTPLMGPYCASKFALEGIAESLRHELFEWGIKVALVEPGAVKTAIWDKGRATVTRMTADADPEMLERYQALIDRTIAGIDTNDTKGVPPLEVAKVVEHALFSAHPRHRYLVGNDARGAGVMAKIFPDRLKDVAVRKFG